MFIWQYSCQDPNEFAIKVCFLQYGNGQTQKIQTPLKAQVSVTTFVSNPISG
jgi:hypothetical protein